MLDHLHDACQWLIHLQFHGVRGWVRLVREEAFSVDLYPGETIILRGEAKRLSVNATLWLALDGCNRAQGSAGAWGGWSTTLAGAAVPINGR